MCQHRHQIPCSFVIIQNIVRFAVDAAIDRVDQSIALASAATCGRRRHGVWVRRVADDVAEAFHRSVDEGVARLERPLPGLAATGLVVGLGQVDIVPANGVSFVTVRALEIDDLDNGLGHAGDTDMTAGFQHHRVAPIEKGTHQRVNFFLLQRLSSRNFNEFCRMACNDGQHLVQRHLAATGIGVLRVAVHASKRTARQAYKHAWLARMCGFTLDGKENLCDAHGSWLI